MERSPETTPPPLAEVGRARRYGQAWRAPPKGCSVAGRRQVYLSPRHDETAAYSAPDAAPRWLYGDVEAQGSKPQFLLRGPRSPALRVLFAPEGWPRDGRTWPAAIVIPGGGYRALSPDEGGPPCRWLAGIGVVAFALRYRLPSHGDPWPAARDDALQAVAFLNSPDGSRRFSVDPDRLMCLGFSAGAHLAAHAISPSVKALVLIYPGRYDAEEIRTTAAAAASAERVGAAALPPVYAVASTQDVICGAADHGDVVVKELRARAAGAGDRSVAAPSPAGPRRGRSERDRVERRQKTRRPRPRRRADRVPRRLGLGVEYQRAALGGHGFGVVKAWTAPCERWLRPLLKLDADDAAA